MSTGKGLSDGEAAVSPQADPVEHVDHPSHYGGDSPYEAIAVMEAWAQESGWDPVQITNLTMALKYIRRHGQKAIAPADQDRRP